MKRNFSISSVACNPGDGFSWVGTALTSFDMDGIQQSLGFRSVKIDGEYTELTSEVYSKTRARLFAEGIIDSGPYQSPLEEEQAARWAAIVRIRDGLETRGFPYKGRVFDSDERSASRINTTAQAAIAAKFFDQDFSTLWVCADNSTIELSREDVIGMPAAFALYASSLHVKARELRERIMEATTVQEVRGCIWEGVEDAVPSNPGVPEPTPQPPVDAPEDTYEPGDTPTEITPRPIIN
ncbi:hypothetical protein ATN89_17410 [Comamonas thiooxydans]|uniref:DUF4376 domain-containing protein n=1 Tax=Comamonas thiooxydans TaxID=363952 RepID=UPI0007C50030|nr:DUF4376 domain-containing protein [Comamonas thiooxydans]OAD82860.1 hypothetical protein ATN89_17410 [Comamonas thiooxydans]